MLCAGCESDPEVDNNASTTPSVTPSIDDYSVLTTSIQQMTQSISSRLSFSDNGLELDWANGDVLRIFDKNNDYYDFAYEDLDDGEDDRYFRFRSDATKPANTNPYTVVYPASRFDDVTDLSKVTIDMTENQVQVGNNTLDHLSDFTFMTGTTESLDEAIYMTHYMGQVKFIMTLPEEARTLDVAKIVMTAYNEDGSENEDAFVVKQIIDCTGESDPEVVERSSSITLHMGLEDSDIGDDRSITAYAMILPTEFENCDLVVELVNTHGTALYTRTEEVASRGFSAGFQHFAMSEDSMEQVYTETITSVSNIQWSQFGPGMSGNNKISYWHPTCPNTLFISPNMGNSYVSYDGGKTFQTLLNWDATGYQNASSDRGIESFCGIDFSYTDENYGFATDNGNSGLFRTYDKGSSWTIQQSSLDQFYGVYLSCIEVDPTDDNIWYLGAGRLRDLTNNAFFTQENPHGEYIDTTGASSCKVWRSDDKGETWTLKNVGLDSRLEVETIIVDPVTPSNIYMSTNYGFWRSTDRGENWTQVDVRPDAKTSTEVGDGLEAIRSMAMHRDKTTNVVTLFVISSVTWQMDGTNPMEYEGGGIYKSTDGGQTWTAIHGEQGGSSSLFIDLQALNSSTATSSFCNCIGGDDDNGYFTDLTPTEAKSYCTSKGYPTSIMQRFHWIVVDPNDVNNIMLNNDYSNASENNFIPGMLWRTNDGGKTWFIGARNGKAWGEFEGSSEAQNTYKYWTETRTGQPMGNNVSLIYLHEWMNRDVYERKSFTTVQFNCDGTNVYGQMAKIALTSYDGGDTWVDIDDNVVDYYDDEDEESYIIIGAGNSNLPGHGFCQYYLEPGDEHYADYYGRLFTCGGENSLWIMYTDMIDYYGGLAGRNYRFTEDEMSSSSYAIDPNDPCKHYALFFRQTNQGKLMRWNDSKGNGVLGSDGVSDGWTVIGTPIATADWPDASGDNSVHQLHLTIDPEDSNTMYFCVPYKSGNNGLAFVGDSGGCTGIYRSTNGGVSWAVINSALPYAYYNANTLDAASVSNLTLNPHAAANVAGKSRIYITTESRNGSLWRLDEDDNWIEVESTKFMTPGTDDNGSANELYSLYYNANNNVDGISRAGMQDIHFNKSGTKVYVTVGSYLTVADDPYCGLWVCDVDPTNPTDWEENGEWRRIFAHPFANRIETAMYDEDLIMFSTLPNSNVGQINTGTYISYDGGKSWAKMNYGNGQSDRVNDIAIDYYMPGQYYVSTYGSGWSYAVDPNYKKK